MFGQKRHAEIQDESLEHFDVLSFFVHVLIKAILKTPSLVFIYQPKAFRSSVGNYFPSTVQLLMLESALALAKVPPPLPFG